MTYGFVVDVTDAAGAATMNAPDSTLNAFCAVREDVQNNEHRGRQVARKLRHRLLDWVVVARE